MNKKLIKVSNALLLTEFKHIFRVMKLTSLFGVLCVSSAFAINVNSQSLRVNIHTNQKQAKEVIKQIEEQTDYLFVYNHDKVNLNNTVTIQANNETVAEVLNQMFVGTDIIYAMQGNNILLMQKDAVVQQSGKVVTGTIVDPSGMPVIGANVMVKGTTNGTITDMDGKFSLEVEEGATLQISYIGYANQEIKVGNQKTLSIALKEDAEALDELVVIGYGTQKKVNLTGAVASVSSEVLESRPVSNVGQALQGVIPNLNVNISNGALNTEPSFNVRGATSISDGNIVSGSPLILVDGVEMNINLLNPEDIESVSVLKDAASAAIYGARAAYGVMLITTKKGKNNEKVRISYSNNLQWNTPAYIPDVLDSYSFQKAIMEGKELMGLSITSDDELYLERLKQYQENPSTAPVYYDNPDGTIQWCGNFDVYDITMKKAAFMHKHNVSITGGTSKNSYYVSFGYQDQDGVFKINSDELKRYNALVNLSSQLTSWWKTNLKVSYNNSNFRTPHSFEGRGGYWWDMAKNNGFVFMPMKTPADSPVGEMYTNSVLAFLDYPSYDIEKKEMLTLTAATEINLMKGLVLNADFSYKTYNTSLKEVAPLLNRINNRWDAPINTHTNPDFVRKSYTHDDYYSFNVYGKYNQSFLQDHTIGVLLGFNQEWTYNSNFYAKKTNLLSDQLPVLSQTLGETFAGDGESHWAIRGAFVRLNYDYKGKYLIEMNGRYDGTSKFPTHSRYKFFPSVSVGWRISEEKFMESVHSVINNLKLRASYGSLGNQNVANYIYIPSYGTTQRVDHVFGNTRPAGITPPGLVNSNLTWETASTVNLAFDLSLFNKLDVSYDWYNRITKDILTAGDKLPSILGTSVPIKNSGELTTKGWEFSLKWRDKLSNGLGYDIGFILSDSKSVVSKFDGNPNKLISGIYEGRTMGEIWGYETFGFFQSEEEIAEAPSQSFISSSRWYPGDIRYTDLNNDGKIDQGEGTVTNSGDKKVIGNSSPRYQFGITGGLSWKNFDFSIFFQGVAKRDIWTTDHATWGYISGGTPLWNVYKDSWTPENRDAYYPLHVPGSAKNIVTQSKYLQNAAYIRLKNLSLGYNIPQKILQKILVERCRIFFSGENLFEISGLHNKKMSPELLTAAYPLTRSYSLGIQVSF